MRISDCSSDVCSSDLVAKDLSGPVAISAIHGLKIAAVAIVAQALIGMARKLTPDVPRIAMAIVSAALMLIIAVPAAQIGLIAIGAVAGLLLCRTGTGDPISNVGSGERWEGKEW